MNCGATMKDSGPTTACNWRQARSSSSSVDAHSNDSSSCKESGDDRLKTKRRSDLKLKISARTYGPFCNTFDVSLSFFPNLAHFSTIGKGLISPK